MNAHPEPSAADPAASARPAAARDAAAPRADAAAVDLAAVCPRPGAHPAISARPSLTASFRLPLARPLNFRLGSSSESADPQNGRLAGTAKSLGQPRSTSPDGAWRGPLDRQRTPPWLHHGLTRSADGGAVRGSVLGVPADHRGDWTRAKGAHSRRAPYTPPGDRIQRLADVDWAQPPVTSELSRISQGPTSTTSDGVCGASAASSSLLPPSWALRLFLAFTNPLQPARARLAEAALEPRITAEWVGVGPGLFAFARAEPQP